MKFQLHLSILGAAILINQTFVRPNSVLAATPLLTDPNKFEIELFADLATLDPPLDAFQITITNGENGFPAGGYIIPGPAPGTLGNRLVRVDRNGNLSVVKEGIKNAETLIFARGDYGDGILIAEPFDLQIRRLLPDGTLETFAENVSTAPFGPSTLAYGPGGVLFATDGASGSLSNGSGDILQINPDGTSEVFASIPESLFPQCSDCFIQVQSALAFASINSAGEWQEGGGFVSGTFSTLNSNEPSMLDALFAVSLDGNVTKLADGVSGINLIELGSGDEFGSDLYVATLGSFPFDETTRGNGAVYTLGSNGTLKPFLTNINAVDVTFDSEGVLGGGMFVTEGTNANGPGKIWRIVPKSSAESVPEPSNILGVSVALSLGTWLKRKRIL